MSDITRCTNCLSLVYDNAKTCHHCEEAIGKKRRRVFTRGSIAFILFSVTVFGVCDAVNLLDDLSDRRRSAHRIFDAFANVALSSEIDKLKRREQCLELWEEDATGPLESILSDCSAVTSGCLQVSTPKYKSRTKVMLRRGQELFRKLTETYTFTCRVWFEDNAGVRTSVLAHGTVAFSPYTRFDCRIVNWEWHTTPDSQFANPR